MLTTELKARLSKLIYARRVVEMESLVIGRAIQDLLAAGYAISVDDGGDELALQPSTDAKAILEALFSVDQEHLCVSKVGTSFRGWVFLVHGNDGWDVISDYTTNLEEALQGTNALADALGDIK